VKIYSSRSVTERSIRSARIAGDSVANNCHCDKAYKPSSESGGIHGTVILKNYGATYQPPKNHRQNGPCHHADCHWHGILF
jgi:hypothetical protein